MELSYLKEIWTEVADEKAGSKYQSGLLVIPARPSHNLISIMRRNLLYEWIAVLVCVTAIALFYFIAFDGRLQEVSWAYLLLALIFTGYYYKKNQLLKSMQCITCVVKDHLQRQLSTLEKYVRFYLTAGTALVPLVMLFFYLLLHYKKIILFSSLQSVRGVSLFALLYLSFTVIFTILFYFANRWYINRLYGRHIQKLKNLLGEMEAL